MKSPSAPSPTTTWVGEVRGQPGPRPNNQKPSSTSTSTSPKSALKKVKNEAELKPVNVDSGHDSPPSSPSSPSPPVSKIQRGSSLTSSAASNNNNSNNASSSAYNSIASSSSSSSAASAAARRPKSQYLAELPPRHPNSTKRHSYHHQQQQPQQQQPIEPNSGISFQRPAQTRSGAGHDADSVTYADLDPKAFMVPKNRVLPPLNAAVDRASYAEISMSRSQLV